MLVGFFSDQHSCWSVCFPTNGRLGQSQAGPSTAKQRQAGPSRAKQGRKPPEAFYSKARQSEAEPSRLHLKPLEATWIHIWSLLKLSESKSEANAWYIHTLREKVSQIGNTFDNLRCWTNKVSKFVRTFKKVILKVKKTDGFLKVTCRKCDRGLRNSRLQAESVIGVSENWFRTYRIENWEKLMRF